MNGRRLDPALVWGAAIIGGYVALALLGAALTPDPNHSFLDVARAPGGVVPPGPSSSHWFGLDALHRDVAARICAGAGVSLFVALAGSSLAVSVAAIVGTLSAFGRAGRTRVAHAADGTVMTIVDIALAFPFLLLIAAVGVAVEETGLTVVTLILGLTSWPGLSRLVRTRALQILEQDYVRAARALGASTPRLFW
ncbi:MAG: ABC transporter permease subunit, partial [Myxococcota bacterium]